MKAKELDKRFDAAENITKALDLSRVQRINQVQRRVNVDFPSWMIRSLDKEERILITEDKDFGRLVHASLRES